MSTGLIFTIVGALIAGIGGLIQEHGTKEQIKSEVLEELRKESNKEEESE